MTGYIVALVIGLVISVILNFFFAWLGAALAMKGASKMVVEIIEMCEEENNQHARDMMIKNYCKYEKEH